MTDYSLNETASRAKLAARGAGYTWGMAEEVARAVFWLVSRELPGPAMLLKLLSNYSTTKSVKLAMPSIIDGRFTSEHAWLCPVAAGCALSDTLSTVDDTTCLSLTDVKCPILLVPFVAEIAQRSGSRLIIEMDNSTMSTDGNSIHISSLDCVSLEQATSVICRNAAAEKFIFTSTYLECAGRRVIVEDPVWEALGTYAHRTYAIRLID